MYFKPPFLSQQGNRAKCWLYRGVKKGIILFDVFVLVYPEELFRRDSAVLIIYCLDLVYVFLTHQKFFGFAKCYFVKATNQLIYWFTNVISPHGMVGEGLKNL